MSQHFRHHMAVVEEGVVVGNRTRIWAFDRQLALAWQQIRESKTKVAAELD